MNVSLGATVVLKDKPQISQCLTTVGACVALLLSGSCLLKFAVSTTSCLSAQVKEEKRTWGILYRKVDLANTT